MTFLLNVHLLQAIPHEIYKLHFYRFPLMTEALLKIFGESIMILHSALQSIRTKYYKYYIEADSVFK